MQAALKYTEINSRRQSFTPTRPWIEFGIFNTRNPNRGPPFLQSRTAPSIRNTENINLFPTPLPKHYNPALNTDYFTEITKKILNDFYPKHCPTPECNNRILDKEISTRPDLIRCPQCRYLTSRLSYTPLHHFKLPIWMFGYILYESLIQYPKVVTATELSKRLRIGYNAASLLKRRFQLFASNQLPKYKKLTYEALNDQFKDFLLPPNENRDITKIMAKKPYTCVDTVVLYSAGERASQGRKRYRHSGQTASIYLSEKLGGRQVGTLVQTIAIKQGPVFFSSVSNQKADTLGPLIKEHLPTCTPLFTDQGYPWLWGIYKNHRSVNHSARSKDNRFRFARNRWSKNGVHNQVAEGNHRVLKTAFAAYGYIKPKYSQMYLNEFSFIKNANVFGLDVLVECDGDDANEGMRCRDRDAFAVNPRAGMKEAVRIERKGCLSQNIIQKFP
ncbi:transposase [Leptospira venezuelensis]|uniref:transposase n=1 Tax=Leptospira venezuelensis TaxID=1958811 RepID=UPI000A3890AC|nr:transposase [Leptospira venezuelensis]